MATDNIALVSMHSDSQGDSHSHEGPPPTSNSTNPARPSEIRPYLRLLFPWFWTVAFVVWLVIVIRVYEAKGVLTKWQKDTFNFITTGLILFLGLSFYEAFKGLANALSLQLNRCFHPSLKLEGFDSMLKVFQLTFDFNTSRGLRAFCAIWLMINIIAQMAAAVISLTYSLDDGTNYNGTYVRSGQVKVSNLTCYMHGHNCPLPITIDALAHAYGDSTLGPDSTNTSSEACGYFTDVKSISSPKEDFPYYCRRNTTAQEFGYRFNEYNPDDIVNKVYPHFTDRVITASSAKCNEYSQVGEPVPVTVGGPVPTTVGDPKTPKNYISAMKYTYSNDSTTGSIVIPTSALGNDGTTYIYQGTRPPAKATTFGNGDRGIKMWVYKNPKHPLFYECPITVSVVYNVTDPRHNITDDVAREAAASIALQGQFRGAGDNKNFRQWQWYANGHPWEIHFQNNSRVGANIAEHAIVSLKGMVARNPPIDMNGTVPYLGTKLSVKWKYFGPLLACIVAADTLVIVLSSLAIRLAPYQQI